MLSKYGCIRLRKVLSLNILDEYLLIECVVKHREEIMDVMSNLFLSV